MGTLEESMKAMAIREGSVIILEDAAAGFAFQLRDNRPDIPFANYWGLFGGWLEPDENPEQAIVREMREELGLTLETARLKYIMAHREGDILAHVFAYPAPSELSSATLYEGQRLEFLSVPELPKRTVVPQHRDIVEWYEIHKKTGGAA